MAHNIDQSTGQPAIAYVGDRPWHKLGERLPEGQPIETWLRAARLEWELKRLPVQYLGKNGLMTMPGPFVLVRTDTDAPLSVVSENYNVVQPKEILEFYRDLAAAYGYTLETAGALNHGKKVWALARTGRSALVKDDKDEGLAAYVLLATSCDKTLATTAAFTSIRVVCDNTLGFALDDIKAAKRREVKVNHTELFKPEDIKERLGLFDSAWDAFLATVQKMAVQELAESDHPSFFERVVRPANKPLSPAAAKKIGTLTALYSAAPGQKTTAASGTVWGAVNAVTYYVDHVRRSSSERLDSAWFGSGNALKERAWLAGKELIGT